MRSNFLIYGFRNLVSIILNMVSATPQRMVKTINEPVRERIHSIVTKRGAEAPKDFGSRFEEAEELLLFLELLLQK